MKRVQLPVAAEQPVHDVVGPHLRQDADHEGDRDRDDRAPHDRDEREGGDDEVADELVEQTPQRPVPGTRVGHVGRGAGHRVVRHPQARVRPDVVERGVRRREEATQGAVVDQPGDRREPERDDGEADQERGEDPGDPVHEIGREPRADPAAHDEVAGDDEEPDDRPAAEVLPGVGRPLAPARDRERVRDEHEERQHEADEVERVSPRVERGTTPPQVPVRARPRWCGDLRRARGHWSSSPSRYVP